jgi:hypothetical protein
MGLIPNAKIKGKDNREGGITLVEQTKQTLDFGVGILGMGPTWFGVEEES